MLSLIVYDVSLDISEQVKELQQTLPVAIDKANQTISQNEILEFLSKPIKKSVEIGRKD